jgi:hypothetical protein
MRRNLTDVKSLGDATTASPIRIASYVEHVSLYYTKFMVEALGLRYTQLEYQHLQFLLPLF